MKKQIDEYLALRQAQGLAETSITRYRFTLERLEAFLQNRSVRHWREVSLADLDAYVDENIKERLAHHTRESFITTIGHFFRWLCERGKLLSDPSRHLKVPSKKADQPLPETPLSEEEVAGLIASLPKRNAVDLRNLVHVELLYSAGLRLRETLALKIGDVDLANRILHVRKGKGRNGGRPRDIPLLRGLANALKDYLALRRTLLRGPDDGTLLLSSRTGRRVSLNNIGQFFSKLSRTRKQRVHPHLLRHSIAVHLLRNGADIRYIQAFLGHDSIESTKIYLRLVPADIKAAYDKAMFEVAVMATA